MSDLVAHIRRQREWSERTFGAGDFARSIVDHIRKELVEIEANPTDLEEWIDVMLLAIDGAWRAGYSPDAIAAALSAKQTVNEWRKWEAPRTDRAIEHIR